MSRKSAPSIHHSPPFPLIYSYNNSLRPTPNKLTRPTARQNQRRVRESRHTHTHIHVKCNIASCSAFSVAKWIRSVSCDYWLPFATVIQLLSPLLSWNHLLQVHSSSSTAFLPPHSYISCHFTTTSFLTPHLPLTARSPWSLPMFPGYSSILCYFFVSHLPPVAL